MIEGYRRQSDEEIKRNLIQIGTKRDLQKHLHISLCVPDTSFAFSLGVEYITNWILKGFYDDFFKSIYVDGTNIIHDYRNKSQNDFIKIQKPALAIKPELDQSFNRDDLDIGLGGTTTYMSRKMYDESFFKDISKNLFLAMDMQLMLIKNRYMIKVNGKPMGIHLWEFCKQRFWAKLTRGEYVDMDFHIPTELLIALAKDVGFEVSEEARRIRDLDTFMVYMNKYSSYPIAYKWRQSKGGLEFFIRVPDQYVHTKIGEVQMIEGDKQGHTDDDYIVAFETEVRIPVPKSFAYISAKIRDKIYSYETNKDINIYQFELNSIPVKNDSGWPHYISFDWKEDEETYKKKKDLSIPLYETLMQVHHGRLIELIRHTVQRYISPNKFMDIKLYTEGTKEYKDFEIDWKSLTIKSKWLPTRVTHIAIYIDTIYINQIASEEGKFDITRMEDAGKGRDLYAGVDYGKKRGLF